MKTVVYTYIIYIWDSITTCHSQDWNSGHCTTGHAEKKKPHYISEADLTPSSGRTGKQDNLLWWSQEKELVSTNTSYTKYILDCLVSQNLVSLLHTNANHSLKPQNIKNHWLKIDILVYTFLVTNSISSVVQAELLTTFNHWIPTQKVSITPKSQRTIPKTREVIVDMTVNDCVAIW